MSTTSSGKMTRRARYGQPDLSAGHCITGTELPPDFWISEDREERALAVKACRCCPVLRRCAEWAESVPWTWRGVVVGGSAPRKP